MLIVHDTFKYWLELFFFSTILKVGNQINDGESNMGFTMDSLLKLNTSKAYDKKTSVLQYVITLLFRNDMDALLLPEDLKSVSEVAIHAYYLPTYIHLLQSLKLLFRFRNIRHLASLWTPSARRRTSWRTSSMSTSRSSSKSKTRRRRTLWR